MQGRALGTIFENLCGISLAAFKLPSWLRCGPLTLTQRRMTISSGEAVVRDSRDDSMYIQFPADRKEETIPTLTHVCDRGSINVALINYCMCRGYLFTVCWVFPTPFATACVAKCGYP